MTTDTKATGERFDARSAAQAIEQAQRFDDGLRRRTEGTTWMMWGLVTAGVMTSALAGEFLVNTGPDADAFWPWALLVPILLWMAAGAAATTAIWRSAALADGRTSIRRGLRQLTVFLGFFVALFLTMSVVNGIWGADDGDAGIAGLPLLVLGAYTLAVAAHALALSATGRRVAVAVGAAQVILALALLTLGVEARLDWLLQGLFAGGTWIAAGLYETLRG